MRRERQLNGRGALLGVLAVLLGLTASPAATENSGGRQSEALAGITGRILRCEAHPCLGDSIKSIREALHDAIVTDDIFYYSDLVVAYPSVRGDLQGLVEWDLDDGLESISMKIIGFDVAPSVVVLEIEQALPGCHMERGGDEEGAPDSGEADDEIPTNEWGCSVGDEGSREVDVDLYFAPGLVMLEIYL